MEVNDSTKVNDLTSSSPAQRRKWQKSSSDDPVKVTDLPEISTKNMDVTDTIKDNVLAETIPAKNGSVKVNDLPAMAVP